MEKFIVQIITPEEVLYSGECCEINLPGLEGRFEVFYGHMNLVALLQPGLLEMKISDNSDVIKFIISEGHADITANECNVIVEKCLNSKNIDFNEIRKDYDEIQQALVETKNKFKKNDLQAELKFLDTILELKV